MSAAKVSLLLLLAFNVSLLGEGAFSTGFQSFLNARYGPVIGGQLARADLGVNASYGGGASAVHFELSHNPVVLVHGLLSYAGALAIGRNFFEANGFTAGSVFATSYGPNGTNVGWNDTLKCDYVKQVRRLVKAVHAYTGRRVNVAGYSMGSAVSRKVILGGRCVDNNKQLGGPLTKKISAFMSVAGLNQGMMVCAQNVGSSICNNVNGVAPGSAYLLDVNRQQHYEGRQVYKIASETDEVVGFSNTLLPQADVNVTLSGFNHVLTAVLTLRSQNELLLTGQLSQQTLNTDVQAASQLLGTNCTGTAQQ